MKEKALTTPQNGAKMDPKRANLKWLSLPFLPSKELLRFLIVFRPVLPPPGISLASLLAPFGSFWPLFWLPLASFGLPFAAFCHPLASSRLPWSFSGLQSFPSPAEAKFWRDLAKILPTTRFAQSPTIKCGAAASPLGGLQFQ